MADITARISDFKRKQVDIEAICSENGVDFTKLSPEVKAAMADIASSAWFMGGEAYL